MTTVKTEKTADNVPPTTAADATQPQAQDLFVAAPAASGPVSQGDRQWKKKEVIREGFKNKTKGEAWFNGISYIGFGYGLVTATSVFMTWLINDTHHFAEKYGKFAEKLTKKFRIPPTFSNIMTLFIGGTIASVLPIKWLEDKKPDIVKKLDRFLYTDEELKDPKIAAAHKELDELPKQTWMSVLGSRFVAFAATLSVFLAMGSNKSPIYKIAGESIDKGSIQLGRWFDRLLHRNNPTVLREIDTAVVTNLEKMNAKKYGPDALKDLQLIRGEGGDRIASRIYSYIGLDAFYTLFTSASLFVFTRVFGGLIGKPQTPPSASSPAKPIASAAMGAPLADAPPTEKTEKPQPRITHPAHMERVAQHAPTAEITA